MNAIQHNSIYLGIALCLFLGVVAYQCASPEKQEGSKTELITDYEGNQFAGSTSCQSCHQQVYQDHLETAHYLTSREADKEHILGSFEEGENILKLRNGIEYKMIEENEQLYQAAYINGAYISKAPFHIIVGSGVKGQSYLYWHKNNLSQLPATYSQAENGWVNSPGYQDDKLQLKRPIIPTCLTCHTTFAKNLHPDEFFSTTYDKKQIILGVQCESCHGPSAKHVSFHQQNPDASTAKFLNSIQKMSRQQKLDACAKCHSGLREPIQKPFSFKTGDKLDDFSKANYQPEEIAKLDVHGNQYGLLTASQCFIQSKTLDCSSCHNPHRKERQKLHLFSQKCIECHQKSESLHQFSSLPQSKITNNCIDCHMPKLPSSVLTMQSKDLSSRDSLMVRTHRIAVYEEVSEELLEYLNAL